MKSSTLVALKAIIESDPPRNGRDRAQLANILQLDNSLASDAPSNRLLSFSEAAKILNRTPRGLHLLAAKGIIRKARIPGAMRFAGVLQSDVEALLTQMQESEARNV